MNLKNKLPSKNTVLSGLLMGISNPLWSLGFISWFSLVPFLLEVQKSNSFKKNFKEAFWLQIFFAISLFFWVPLSVKKLWPETNWITNILCFSLFLIIVELHILIWGTLRYYLKDFKYKLFIPILSGLIYIILDNYSFKFVKDSLGHNFHDHLYIKQLAYFIGVYGLTFLIIFINEMWVWSLNKKSKILIPLSFIATFYLIGFLEFKKVEAGQEVDVTVVQPNFLFKDPLKEKMNHEDYLIHKTESFINLVIEAKNKYPDNKILVFPETSYPIYFYSPESFAHEELNNQLKNLVETLDIELFFGGFKRENGLNSNVYIHLYKKDELVLDSFYTKTRLFPFGEEVPFSDVFPFLNKIFPSSTISFKGNDYKYKELKSIDAKYGVQICFESITTHVLKEMKKEGLPNIILNPTNESSFINFGEPQLALALSSFRAVESRRPMIRSALTGISAYINTKGEIIEPTSMDKKEIKNYKIIIPF